MLYRNCRELLYHNFNEIQITGDLTYLIKDNAEHGQEELREHWVEILEEYCELSNNYEQKKFFRDKAELKNLEIKLNVLNCLKPILELDLSDEQRANANKVLKKYRIDDVDRGILGTKDDINIKIKKLQASLDGKETTTFEEIISALRINQINVSRRELTVSEYVSLLKELKKKSSKTDK